jgi:hypothetical protein
MLLFNPIIFTYIGTIKGLLQVQNLCHLYSRFYTLILKTDDVLLQLKEKLMIDSIQG